MCVYTRVYKYIKQDKIIVYCVIIRISGKFE